MSEEKYFLIKVVDGEDAYIENLRYSEKIEPEKSLLSLGFEEARKEYLTTKIEPGASGFVYLIQVDDRTYMIGKTQCLETRYGFLEVVLPCVMESIHSIETDNPINLEQYFYNHFARQRLDFGDRLFQLSDDDIEAFKNWHL